MTEPADLSLLAMDIMLFTTIWLTSILAVPPAPPTDFASPESPPRPAPFPVRLVDQGQTNPKLKGILAPEGFRVEIVADAPTVINPTGLAFAPDGTLFVTEWTPDPVTEGRWFEVQETVHYKDGTTRLVTTMKKFVVDPIKVLKWNAAKGVYDKAQTIIAEELPSTLLWHDGWLYTASRGTVRRYKQSRPGGSWDIRETIAQGFCGFHHHQVSGLTIGNDGKLYITSGDDDNVAEGSDGSRATAWRTGAIFRCNPDGSQIETYSLGYRNPYRDIAFDDRFNFFHADNDNEDGSKFTGCRLVHVAEGVDYGWRLKVGARCCRPDFTRGAVAGELPGKLPPMLKTGRGSPAGLLIYNDTRMPTAYRGLQYYPDVFRKLIRAYKVSPRGASFEVTNEFEFMKSTTDPLFRPCHMITGPDGAIYVCDWRTDSGGAGRLFGDGVHGRIYKLTWIGNSEAPGIPTRGLDSWAKLLQLPTPKLVEMLDAPDFTDRVEARKELIRRGTPARDAVLRRFISGQFTLDGRLVALGVLQAHWNTSVEDLHRLLLNDESADVRRLALDGIALHGRGKDARNHEAVVALLTDEHPAVRRSVALALARIGHNDAAHYLVKLWIQDNGRDPFLSDAIIRGMERIGKPAIAELVAHANGGHGGSVPQIVKAFQAFRTEAGAAALPSMLANGQLSQQLRADLVRSYANYQFDPPLRLDSLVEFLLNQPRSEIEVSIAGLEILSMNEVNNVNVSDWMIEKLESTNAEVRLAALKAITTAQVTSAGPRLAELLANRDRPMAERIEILNALKITSGNALAEPLTKLLSRDEPVALKVLALRTLSSVSPEQARAAATKLLDSSDASLLAEAVTVLGATKDGAKLIGERYVAQKLPKELFPRVSEAVKKFAAESGMSKLHDEVMKGSLRLTLDADRAAELGKLIASKGDAARGKALYLNTKVVTCATCHKLEGVGGSTGPDLTRVWDTQTTAKLLEAIIEPSKEIKEGYQSFKATTSDGRSFIGLKVSDTAKEITLRDANSRDIKILKEDLESLTPSKTSLMPDDTVARLTFEQFLDLAAFLKDRTAQESLRGTVLEYSVATGFKTGLSMVEPLEKDLKWKDWLKRPVDVTGRLDLAQVWSDSASAYALAYVYSPKRQKITLRVTADDTVRVSVNGKSIYEGTQKLPESLSVEVPSGWTPILVKLAGRGPSHMLSLQVSGDALRTAATAEAK